MNTSQSLQRRTGLGKEKFPTAPVYQTVLKNWMKVWEEKRDAGLQRPLPQHFPGNYRSTISQAVSGEIDELLASTTGTATGGTSPGRAGSGCAAT